MNSTMNYYELLGINKDATEDEIRLAYKKQMKKWHPDINKSSDAVSMSAKINEAKEVLLDDLKRRDYNEYLNKKTNETYNRYTQMKKTNENTSDVSNNNYEDKMITKWEYLKQWLKFSTATKTRKVFGFIGVMLESFLCTIIKFLLILVSYICNIGSYIIRMIFNYLYPVIGLIIILFIFKILTDGFKQTIIEQPGIIKGIIISISVFILSFLLPLFSKFIISPKIFNILYNKIDINLFKKCVDYKDSS